ncbi:hypothetical protein GEMRC1_003314 [Eukaryota sp. GEM-RC1]
MLVTSANVSLILLLFQSNSSLETNALYLDHKDLCPLFSFASFFDAEVHSIFLDLASSESRDYDFLNCAHVVTGLRLNKTYIHDFNLIFSRLKSLYLGCNETNDDLLLIAEALGTNSTVIELKLTCYSVDAIDIEVVKAFAEALRINSTITSINLQANDMTDDHVLILERALQDNSTLTTIDLSENSIGDAGAVALARLLTVNSVINSIDLCYNSIGDTGAIALANALKFNSTVTKILLFSNSIGDDGALAFADVLDINSTITEIHLGLNPIEPGNQRA